MEHHAEATLGDTDVEFGWAPCFKVGSVTWHVNPKDIKVINDQHFVKVPRSAGSHSFRTILVAVSDGAINSHCDLMKSNGYAKLIELKDEAVAKLEMASELAKLPSWQADHVAKATAVKKLKRKLIDSAEESRVLDLEFKLVAFDDHVTVKALSDTDAGQMLWIEMTPQSMLYIWQYIIEQGFADDRMFRSYVKRGVPKGVTVIPCKGDDKFRVKLPKSAISEAAAIDSSKRPRKSVTCRTLEEAQAVLNDPVAFVFPSATDDVDDRPDNDDADDDAAGHDEHDAGEVNAAEVTADV
jgi:hypothetical protein